MTTDPFRCDAVFSVALLLAFTSLSPSLFAISLPDWIVVSVRPDVPCGNLGCASGRASGVSNDAEGDVEIQPTSMFQEASRMENTTEFATNVSRTLGSRNMPAGRKSPRSIKQILEVTANFNYVCVKNSTAKGLRCLYLTAANFAPNATNSCDQEPVRANVSQSLEDVVECDLYAIGKAMFQLARDGLPAVASTTAICTVGTVMLNILAVYDRGYPLLKFLLGWLFLGSGIAQVVVLLEVRFLISNLPVSGESEAFHGAAAYFSSIASAFNIFASLALFVSSYTERPAEGTAPKSKGDVPFQNTPDQDEFIKIQDDESEEWGFFPRANDLSKEVRFKLAVDSPTVSIHNSQLETTLTENKDQSSGSHTNENLPEEKIEGGTLTRFQSEEFVIEKEKFETFTEQVEANQDSVTKRVVFFLPSELSMPTSAFFSSDHEKKAEVGMLRQVPERKQGQDNSADESFAIDGINNHALPDLPDAVLPQLTMSIPNNKTTAKDNRDKND